MNKEEILQYLIDLRQITAPMAKARQRYAAAEQKLTKVKNSFGKSIIIFSILSVLFFMMDSSGVRTALIFAAIAIALIVLKYVIMLPPAQQEFDEANNQCNTEASNPAYIEGAKGFPERFYNYHDIYRLYTLIDEGRADNLKEAYNVLENQHFQEDQLSVQEEIRSLQEDVARSARQAAASSTISAINSFRRK